MAYITGLRGFVFLNTLITNVMYLLHGKSDPTFEAQILW